MGRFDLGNYKISCVFRSLILGPGCSYFWPKATNITGSLLNPPAMISKVLLNGHNYLLDILLILTEKRNWPTFSFPFSCWEEVKGVKLEAANSFKMVLNGKRLFGNPADFKNIQHWQCWPTQIKQKHYSLLIHSFQALVEACRKTDKSDQKVTFAEKAKGGKSLMTPSIFRLQS